MDKSSTNPNIPGAIRDVLKHSIDKGQFITAVAGLIFCYLISRMSQPAVDQLVLETKDALLNTPVLGYVISALFLLGWWLNVLLLCRNHKKQMDSINKELELYRRPFIDHIVKKGND